MRKKILQKSCKVVAVKVKKKKNKNKAFILNASLACLPEETCILINTKVGSYEGLRKYVLSTRRTTKDRG